MIPLLTQLDYRQVLLCVTGVISCRMGVCFVIILWVTQGVHAQSYTISGYVEDARTKERLVGATLFEEGKRIGATTNAHGFYSITLPAGTVMLRVSYVGYGVDTLRLALDRDIRYVFRLEERSVVLGDVEVMEELAKPAGIEQIQLSLAEIRQLPAFLGESDVLKALQLLPGIQSGQEGTTGLYVRGGGPDQNLILLDGVPVYNAAHIFGFVSVFNTDAIQSVSLIKGGFPSRYGGRLSSVIDITMKEGNLQEYAATGSLGLLASRLMVEGPIVKDKSSFAISGRRTYLDVLARPFLNRDDSQSGYYFYDFNAKGNYVFSNRSRLYFSLYGGGDRFSSSLSDVNERSGDVESTDSGLYWGNLTSALRWTRLISQKLFLSTTILYSRYQLETTIEEKVVFRDRSQTESFLLDYSSGLSDFGAKIDVDYLPGARHAVKFGLGATHHTFRPGSSQRRSLFNDRPAQDTTLFPTGPQEAVEISTYIEDVIQIGSSYSVNIGLHGSAFHVEETRYMSLQPRLSIRYQPHVLWGIHASFTTMRQYIHLLANSGVGLPTDLWVPATARIKPQDAIQASLGVERMLPRITLSVVGFYKSMQNLIEYKEGADFLATGQDWQDKVEVGRGKSYGAEVFLQKKMGQTIGWIGYTWSRTTRRFSEINRGRTFPYRYDRRHDASLTITRNLSLRRSLSISWVYGTGTAVTLPIGRFWSGGFALGNISLHYDSRNGVRTPPYHRLDVAYRITYPARWGEGELSLGLYNVYNRKNPFYLFLDVKEDLDPQTGTTRTVDAYKQVSLFPILPSINYHFTF